MAQILIRNLSDDVVERLRRRAAASGKSVEQTVRDILTQAARPSREEILADMDRIRREIGPVSLDATDLIREDRDRR